MILQPPNGMGDPNASRRAMMAQLLQGSPMPAAQPNAAAALSNGLGSAMQRPEFQKYLQSLFAPAQGVAPMSMGPFFNPTTGLGS